MQNNSRTTEPSSSSPRVALVTGTSSGIGLAVSIAAAGAGWTIVATLRDPESAAPLSAAAATAGVELDIQILDVTRPETITTVLGHIVSAYGRLDAVVNNAGAAALGTIELMTMEQVRASMEVNFFGAVAVTRAAFPSLRRSAGRVITITSVGGAVGQPFNEAYCAAKFALEGFMESLHPVAKTVGVAVTVIEPAAVTTDFVSNAGIKQIELLAGAGPYRPALTRSLDRTMRQFDPSVAQSADEIAAVVVAALSDTAPVFRQQTSPAARALVGAKLADLDGTRITGLTSTWVSA